MTLWFVLCKLCGGLRRVVSPCDFEHNLPWRPDSLSAASEKRARKPGDLLRVLSAWSYYSFLSLSVLRHCAGHKYDETWEV